MDGPPRKSLLDILDTVKNALDAVPDLLTMLENLLGEELVIRFDWKPEIKSWGFDPAAPLFVVHDPHAFIVTVEARVKKSGGPPKMRVLCGLHHFDLVLIAPASFMELNFEKIEFSVDSASKTDVRRCRSTDIKFVGPLSFVETLRDLIPLDGFSDPPHLDITPQGIDAGFSVALPSSLAIGLFNLSNLSLGAGFTVPFIGQPLSVRFNFCTREQPFLLTVSMFGGGGFFGVTLDPHGVQILEAAFEFGAAISIDFGVASGGVSVMAGIYFRMESNAASLAGYFRLAVHVDVLGLITASLELYLELRYEFETGKAAGRASLTIEISVFVFSGSVTISCERKFAGSNGDPTFRQLMGLSDDPRSRSPTSWLRSTTTPPMPGASTAKHSPSTKPDRSRGSPMARQQILWTVMPYGREHREGPLKGRRRVSIVVSPRLTPEAADEQVLSAFAQWLDWPETLRHLEFGLEIAGDTVRLERIEHPALAPDSALVAAALSGDAGCRGVPVQGHEPGEPALVSRAPRARVRAAALHGAVAAGWQRRASDAAARESRRSRAEGHARRAGHPHATDQLRPPKHRGPAARGSTGSTTRPRGTRRRAATTGWWTAACSVRTAASRRRRRCPAARGRPRPSACAPCLPTGKTRRRSAAAPSRARSRRP